MVSTITVPSADEQRRISMNKVARKTESMLLAEGQSFAAVVLKLAPSVQKSDYPALAAAIKNITGIQGISLMIDGISPTGLPTGEQLRLYVAAHLRIEDTK